MSRADPLSEAAAIEDPYERARALVQMADELPEGERGDVLDRALRTAHEIGDPRHEVEVMMLVARRQPREREATAREALQRASKAGDPEWLAGFLSEVGPDLPREALLTARNIAEGLEDEEARLSVMDRLGLAFRPGDEPADEQAARGPHELPPETAIARIDTVDGRPAGGGVLIASDLVLTASHVVRKALGLSADSAEAPSEPVLVRLPFADLATTAHVEAWREDERLQIATLRLSTPVGAARPARLGPPRAERPVRSFGFPDGHDSGLWAATRIAGRRPDGLFDLEPSGLDLEGSGLRLDPGFGGAAVWEADSDAMVGMVLADRATAIMAPSPLLEEAIADLRTGPASATSPTPEGEPPPRTAVTAGRPPSARVHADRWTVEDRLDYALYAKAIAEFIRHPDATPPMVISVQAPWGQGKTSLMRMVQANLDPDHPDLLDGRAKAATATVEPPSELTFGELRDALDGTVGVGETRPAAIRTVWFNAWKYQSSEQIWAGLAHAILSQLPARLSAKDRELFWLRLQLRRIDPTAVRNDIHRAALERFLPRLASWAVLALGTLVVLGLSLLAGGLGAAGAAVAGSGVLGAVALARRAWATATRDVLQRRLEGSYLRYVRQPDYADRLGYLHLVEEDMVRALDLLTPDDQPVVIFIDDLDRCSPAKIGEVLEAVNLFLAGDYPNCAFVIGIDAEVVAASMEVVHAAIIGKLDDRRGELGWRFMDKFVQLPFVMPRLHPGQREAYLRGLLWTAPEQEARQLVAEAERLESEIRDNEIPVEVSARRVAELAPRLAAVAPERARALGEEVVSAGARAFSDNDPEVIAALADQMRYLSDNPRTIKRAVNLYRFHRFAAFARQASTLPLEVATPEQIGRWVVAIIRWPHFVRWLQAQRDESASPGQDPAARVMAVAREADSADAFTEALRNSGIEATWTDESELWEFLREETSPELELQLAGPRGLW